MQFRRTLLGLLCVFSWLTGALHEDLEAADLMVDHQHHSAVHHAHEGMAPDSHEHEDSEAEHSPVWARDEARMISVVAAGLLVCLLAVLFVLPAQLSVPSMGARFRFVPDGPGSGVAWQFLWRCAAPALAPPSLN